MKPEIKISALSTMTAKELQVEANKEGLAWYNREEKRKMRKDEILAMLTEHYTNLIEQDQNLEIENSTTVQLVTHFKELASNAINIAKEDFNLAAKQLNDVKELLSNALVKLQDKLTDKKNKLLARNWALTINNIKCIVTTAERKINAVAA